MQVAARGTSRATHILAGLMGLALGLALLCLFAPSASATKEVVAYFGTEAGTGSKGGEFAVPAGVAVNTSGAGPADKGDIYVTDARVDEGARIQHFSQNDNGTPTNPYDDKYEFISAWGADVDATPSGGTDYEICTVAAECKFGVPAGGNGTPAGNGALAIPIGVTIDQDTGNVYVVNASTFEDSKGNISVAVYAGDGTFLRSFGRDVVESGPGNTGTGYEICVAADGDICKGGVSGSGPGELKSPNRLAVSPPDGNPGTGSVYVVNSQRVNTYALDGSSPSSFGSAAEFTFGRGIAVDSRGIVYVSQIDEGNDQVVRYDSQNANGGGVGFLAPIPAPPLLGQTGVIGDVQVDPDSDGPGPDTDVLYVLKGDGTNNSGIQQFGPVNAPGLIAPPVAADDFHGGVFGFKSMEFNGLGVDDSNGKLFLTTNTFGAADTKSGVYVLDTAGGPPSASLDSLSDITASTVTVHGTVDPNGPPPVDYRIEYSTDGSTWLSTPAVTVGTQEEPQSIEAVLNPPGGLAPGTFYHVRLVVTKQFNPPIVTPELTFTTLTASPDVETTGSPVRTTTTARLEGRVNPRNAAATYHFEYGSQGPCSANPCTATDPVAAGSGDALQLVSEQVEGLEPNTTYHYRVVADNGNAGGPAFGEDMTVTTRASDAPLTHGDFPGPPGSDRAYEQVSLPEAGGNPVSGGAAIADNGERVHYQVFGGSPSSDTGSILNQYYAERVETAPHQGSWQNKNILPPRAELVGPEWLPTVGRSDLSSVLIPNRNLTTGAIAFWRISPGAEPVKLFEGAVEDSLPFGASSGSSRAVARLEGGGLDPDFPTAAAQPNLYDLSSGTPELLSILPGGTPPACGVPDGATGGSFGLPQNWLREANQWVSRDGSLVFFPSKGDSCGGPAQVFLRDLDAESTELISGPTVSGTDCGTAFIKSTPDAAFLWTQSRLVAGDSTPAGCGGSVDGDIYRYDLGDGSLDCLTCLIPGVDSDVFMSNSPGGAGQTIAVAPDGSRVYFGTSRRLLVGVPTSGPHVYRLDVQTGDLRWVASGFEIGEYTLNGNAISSDGSVLVFRSNDLRLNPLGEGSDNGGTVQYYRYDDRDRSLICVSCPQDGSAPIQGVPQRLTENAFTADQGASPNLEPLTDDGDFVFSTSTPLLGPDQNTYPPQPILGTDVYEWRDGRLLLVSDGITTWPHENSVPKVNGVGASGRDVFITVAAQYTPDALDAYFRMYDVRIGGGFTFPVKPKPCPLEVCQGTPKGAPEEAAPGTGAFAGPGNLKGTTTARKSCPKGKRKVRRGGKARCVKPKRKASSKRQRANHDRRNAR